MTDLRDELLAYIPVDLHNTNYIPRAAHSLSNKIKRIAPMLRRQGIQVIPDRSNQARGYIITKTKKYYAGDASDTHLDQKVVRGINV